MNTTQLKEFAQLSQASYALFMPTSFGNSVLTIRQLREALNGAFSATQAELFTNRYVVLHQFTDVGLNGFSATVFQDKDNPNRLVLSFRGTEFEGDKLRDLLISDLQIGIAGFAIPQALPLYRYIKQLQTAAGEPVNYAEAILQSLYKFSDGLSTYASFKTALLLDKGISAGQAAGTAVLAAGKEIDLAGHSLGGHLAILAQRLFPGIFDDVVTVNAVGFYAPPIGIVARPLAESLLSEFGQWDNSKIVRLEAVGDGVSKLATFYPGTTITVGIETRPSPLNSFSANHSVANVADGLALTELIGKLDSRYLADPRIIRVLFDSASNAPISSYEKLLDALRNLILGRVSQRPDLMI